MLDKIIKNINAVAKLLILLILILIIAIAKSIYLILFITILNIILLCLTDNFKKYIKFLKTNIYLLLFFELIYIIIFREIFKSIFFLYKIILIITLIRCIFKTLNFNQIHLGIYKIIRIFRLEKNKAIKISYNISLYIYLFLFQVKSKETIEDFQQMKGKKTYGFKYRFLPSLLMTTNLLKQLEDTLEMNFYKLKEEKMNFKSLIILILFIILFFIAMFKEVIL